MAAASRPTSPPPSPVGDDDWADQAADTVVKVVDAVREKTTGPILTAARAVVYGMIGVFAGLVALIVLTIALVRLVDVYLPGEVWSAHLLIGTLFTVGGLLVWRKRYAPEAA
jgi:hypothetical protein